MAKNFSANKKNGPTQQTIVCVGQIRKFKIFFAEIIEIISASEKIILPLLVIIKIIFSLAEI